MSKEVGKMERKKRSSSVGSFFFGWFIGFILTVGLIAGVGIFAYFNVSADWLNNTFKTEIDAGSKELNSLTAHGFVGHLINIVNNIDNYTINNINTDFGVEFPDEIVGIDISDLKDVKFKDFADALTDKLSSISASELEEIAPAIADIDLLSNKIKYYFNNGVLYTKNEFIPDNEVSFEYTVDNNSQITLENDHAVAIVTEKGNKVVNIQLKYLPLMNAIDDYTSNLGDNLTLKDLKTSYGVNLPSYIYNGNENATVNELTDVVNNLYIADVLGYEIDKALDTTAEKTDKDKWVVKNGATTVTGAIAELSKMQINGMGSIQSTINDLTIAEVMDYYIDTTTGKVYTSSAKSTEVTGVMKAIAKFTVGSLNSNINTLSIADIMDYYKDGDNYYTDKTKSTKITGVMAKLASVQVGNLGNIQSTINSMTISEVLDYYVDTDGKIYTSSAKSTEVTGVMKAIANTTVGGLTEKVGSLKIGDALGYYYDTTDNKFYLDDTKAPITGILGVFVDLTISEMSNDVLKQKVNELTLGDIFETTELSTGIFSLLNVDGGIQAKDIKINELTSKLQTAIKDKTLGDLKTAGLIGDSVDLTAVIPTGKGLSNEGKAVAALTLDEAINVFTEMIEKINEFS